MTVVAQHGASLSVVVNEVRQLAPKARDPNRVVDAILDAIRQDIDIAIGCIFAVPVRAALDQDENRVVSVIRGPSVRLAEIIRHYWGGIWIEEIGVREYQRYVAAKVMGVDVVTGNLTCAVGVHRVYSNELWAVLNAKLAAVSKAKRNVILDLVPKAMVADRLVNKIRGFLLGKRASLEQECKKLLTAWAQRENKSADAIVKELENRLGVVAKELDSKSFSPDFALTVIEYGNAVKDGVVQSEEKDSAVKGSAVANTTDTSGSQIHLSQTEEAKTSELWTERGPSVTQEGNQRAVKVRPLRRTTGADHAG